MPRQRDTAGLSDEHNSRGIELADRGWLDEAIKEFRKAIELDPQSGHAYDNLATVYAEKKQYRDALVCYTKSIELEGDSATAHYNLACFLAAHGLDFAVSEYKEAIEHDPSYPDAHLNLGLTYADQGLLDEAAKELKTAADLDPSDPLPKHELAALQMEDGDFRSAIALLKEVTRLDPQRYDAFLDLGICYAQKGFYAEAERAYTRASELEGDHLLLHYNQAALYALWNRAGEAKVFLAKAVTQDAEKVRHWLTHDVMFDALKGDPEFEKLAHP